MLDSFTHDVTDHVANGMHPEAIQCYFQETVVWQETVV